MKTAMRGTAIKTAALAVLMGAPAAQAASVSFTGFTMDFVEIGDAGNGNDGASGSTAYGGVPYAYSMGTHEVSEAMIDSYNTNSGGPAITKDSRGANQPATSVSWNEAARFVNWLNTSQGHQAAYNVSGGVNTDITLWSSADAWQQGGENLFRHKDAHYFLPSEDEWYKAAYYDGDTDTYYDFATGSDSAPTTTSGGTAVGTAVYRDGVNPNPPGPADIANAGGLSPYGTMGQNGNVWEWGESAFSAPNDTAGESRVFRGGSWLHNSNILQSSNRFNNSPTLGYDIIGFRVAAVPEPSSMGLLVIGAVGFLLRRKRD